MEVLRIGFFLCNHCWGRNSWLCHFVNVDFPVESRLKITLGTYVSEVAFSLVWDSVTDANVHTGWSENIVDLMEHLLRVWSRTISALLVHLSLLPKCNRSMLYQWLHQRFPFQNTRISHLFVDLYNGWSLLEEEVYLEKSPTIHVWAFFLVEFCHLFDYCIGDVNVCDVLKAFFVHFLTHPYVESPWLTWVSSSNIENVESRHHILSYNILDSAVSLEPIELFCISDFRDLAYLWYLSSQYSGFPYCAISLNLNYCSVLNPSL